MPDSAEIAFTVEEEYHGLGIASLILSSLAEIARDNGLMSFEAEVLTGNAGMLTVFRKSGLAIRQSLGDGSVHVTLDLSTVS
ncbi:MAG: GNAT family N-acetyltransferase [Pseudomonadota bacterium]